MLNFENYRQDVDILFAAALAAAEPGNAVRRCLRRDGERLIAGSVEFDLKRGRVFVVAAGKAAAAMAEATLELLGDAVYRAGVISKRGAQTPAAPMLAANPAVRLMEGSHPVSGEDSVQATAVIMEHLAETTADDLVLCLISGGASALLTQPIVSLADWQALVSALLACGCTINELNTVRRQLDRVKGGGLARLAAPAQCLSLILSDVVGNPLEAIGSGPTVLSAESPADALAILARYELAAALGAERYQRIEDVLLRRAETETAVPRTNEIIIVGDVKQAAEAVGRQAKTLGFVPQVLTVHLEGEARQVGRVAAAIARDAPPGRCLVLGGETTVTINGNGLGGRNLEVALSAAISLQGCPATAVASLATDGEDGPTPAAGAVVTGQTAICAADHGLNPQKYLDRNDSYHFFERLDALCSATSDSESDPLPPSLVVTGSTGTNVNDLLLILTYKRAQA